MIPLAASLAIGPVALVAYVVVVYPVTLALLTRGRRRSLPPLPEPLPEITVVMAVHNGEHTIRPALQSLLEDGYPPQRRSIVVVLDACSDQTCGVIRALGAPEIRLVKTEVRIGKTGAENLAFEYLTGTIVVCADAGVMIERGSLCALVRHVVEAGVGVASCTDVTPSSHSPVGFGERLYVKWEMRVRDLESRWCGSVGASGCLYAMRRGLFDPSLDPSLTRDFATVLSARRLGLRAVCVPSAKCTVGISPDLCSEYDRKVRTVMLGLQTMMAFPDLVDLSKHGRLAFALISHKVCRWLLPISLLGSAAGWSVLAYTGAVHVLWTLLPAGLLGLTFLSRRGRALTSYLVLSVAATMIAWARVLAGHRTVHWRPTERSI